VETEGGGRKTAVRSSSGPPRSAANRLTRRKTGCRPDERLPSGPDGPAMQSNQQCSPTNKLASPKEPTLCKNKISRQFTQTRKRGGRRPSGRPPVPFRSAASRLARGGTGGRLDARLPLTAAKQPKKTFVCLFVCISFHFISFFISC
jgi:hypothetical protein